jgi:hypothetical protein
LAEEENHKGNYKPNWGWKLALPTQRGLSLFKSITERIDLVLCSKARSLRQIWVYSVGGNVEIKLIGKWSHREVRNQ